MTENTENMCQEVKRKNAKTSNHYLRYFRDDQIYEEEEKGKEYYVQRPITTGDIESCSLASCVAILVLTNLLGYIGGILIFASNLPMGLGKGLKQIKYRRGKCTWQKKIMKAMYLMRREDKV